MDGRKLDFDPKKNHDRTDVSAALARKTADGSGFKNEKELDAFDELRLDGKDD